MINNPNAPKKNVGRAGRIILRSQIEEAQRHTNSNAAAARWLQVDYTTYKKYATLYGLFERHLNPTGIGTPKGFAKRPTSIPLRDILAGKHPKYSLAKLKNRLLARHKLTEQCSMCGFAERRVTDGKVPLLLTFADGDTTNFNLTNLELRCYNCTFLTSGAPNIIKANHILTSLTTPEKIPRSHDIPKSDLDMYDSHDVEHEAIELSEAEKAAWLAELE